MRRKISLFVIMILLSVSILNFSSISVNAETVMDNSYRSQAYRGLTNAFGTMGYILGPNARDAIYDFACNMLSWLPTYEETGQAEGVTYDATTGLITMNAAVMQELKDCIEEYFTQEENVPDVIWMPVVRSGEIPAANFSTTTKYYQMRSYMDEHELALFSCAGAVDVDMFVSDASDIIFYGFNSSMHDENAGYVNEWCENWGYSNYAMNSYSKQNVMLAYLYAATIDGTKTNFYFDGYYTTDGWVSYDTDVSKNSMVNIQYPFNETKVYPNDKGYAYLIACDNYEARYIPLFRDLSSYKNYIVGQADFYQLTPTYQGGDITVNPNIDYGQIYDAVSNAMKDSTANGESMTQQLAAMQVAYGNIMQEMNDSLGNIEDNTEESNSLLEQIEQNTDETNQLLSDPDGNSWLEQIFLQDKQILEAIQKGFSDLLGIFDFGGDDDSGGSGSDNPDDDSGGGSDGSGDNSDDSDDGSGGDSDTDSDSDGSDGSGDDSGGDSGGDGSDDSGGGSGGDSIIVGGGDSSGSDKEGWSIWKKIGELFSVIFTTILELIAKVIYKFFDGILYLVNIVVEYSALAFDYIGTLIERLASMLPTGQGSFFHAVYDIIPAELRDVIGFAVICIGITGIISYVKR